jgi:hypothetical protein
MSYTRDLPAPLKVELLGWAALLTLAVLNLFR